MAENDTVTAVVDRYLAALKHNSPSEEIAALFSSDCDYSVPGDKSVAWWVGRRHGRDGIADFYNEMREALEPIAFNVEAVVTDGENGVVIGDFASRVRRTNMVIESPFIIHLVVRGGLISRYLFLEDSAAARNAVLGQAA